MGLILTFLDTYTVYFSYVYHHPPVTLTCLPFTPINPSSWENVLEASWDSIVGCHLNFLN